jgi:hypothetical protein
LAVVRGFWHVRIQILIIVGDKKYMFFYFFRFFFNLDGHGSIATSRNTFPLISAALPEEEGED